MSKKIKTIEMPNGYARKAFRLPTWLYRAHLGWLLGYRFMLLTHMGRKSGVPRKTVLEVVRNDPATGTCTVASGWGTRSDWFHNVTAGNKISIQICNKRTSAVAERLSPESGAQELLEYSRRHPLAIRELVPFMGCQFDGTEDDIRTLGSMIPIFRFKPVSENE